MKQTFLTFLLFVSAAVVWAEPVIPPPKTTAYTRIILTATNAADFASKSGISTNGTTTNGVNSINGIASPNQTITITTNNAVPSISDSGTNHAVNIPLVVINTTNPFSISVSVPTFAASTNKDLWYNPGNTTNWIHFIAAP